MIGWSASLINKYSKKRDRDERRTASDERRTANDEIDPHYGCPFFKFCWDQGMKLPSIDNCPGCSREADDLFRSESTRRLQSPHRDSSRLANRSTSRRVSVHDQLGPRCDEQQEFHEELNRALEGKFVEEN